MQFSQCVTINSVTRNKLEAKNVYWAIDTQALTNLLQGPAVNGLWYNSLDKMRDAANDAAQIENAEYGSAVHQPDNEWNFPPGGYIYTKNYKARVDAEHYHTLLMVRDMAPSLIAEAGVGMDLGNGYSYDPRGRGSSVRGPGGRFVKMDGVTRGQRNTSEEE